MKKNNIRQILNTGIQTALSILMVSILLSADGSISNHLQITGIGACACLILLSVFRLREEIAFNRLIKNLQDGIDDIVSGNYATRFHTGECAAMDEIIFGINQVTELLETTRAESIRSESSRKRLLSDISHDIRTPITSIIGYIGALKDDIASDNTERDDYIEILEAKSRALKSMVEDIFQLAKLDADEITMSPECFDLAELVRETLIEFLPEINSAEILLVTDIPDDSIQIVADRMSVSRIVRNLVQNAIQHGKDNKYLHVSVTGSAETPVSISVADRGNGIPEDDIPRVFTRLYRRDAARNRASGSSGLGLTIVQSLVYKNDATINVTSKSGGETVFKVTFRTACYDLRKS